MFFLFHANVAVYFLSMRKRRIPSSILPHISNSSVFIQLYPSNRHVSPTPSSPRNSLSSEPNLYKHHPPAIHTATPRKTLQVHPPIWRGPQSLFHPRNNRPDFRRRPLHLHSPNARHSRPTRRPRNLLPERPSPRSHRPIPRPGETRSRRGPPASFPHVSTSPSTAEYDQSHSPF